MRISDWSSDVCSSDLALTEVAEPVVDDGFLGLGGGTSYQPRQAAPVAPAGPAPGTVVDGFRFRGGHPHDPTAWEPAQCNPGSVIGPPPVQRRLHRTLQTRTRRNAAAQPRRCTRPAH